MSSLDASDIDPLLATLKEDPLLIYHQNHQHS